MDIGTAVLRRPPKKGSELKARQYARLISQLSGGPVDVMRLEGDGVQVQAAQYLLAHEQRRLLIR